uniref:Phospholipase B-like n=1 Tax=Strongyloides papillosus TaxID=174720 RepID=A0A0N5BE53_STREA
MLLFNKLFLTVLCTVTLAYAKSVNPERDYFRVNRNSDDIAGDWDNSIVPDDFSETGTDTLYRVKSACFSPSTSTYTIVEGNVCQNEDLLVATGRFKNAINTTGWSNFEVETFNTVEPHEQAFAAGFLEGNMTHSLLSNHIQNAVQSYCDGFAHYCERLKPYLKESFDWVKSEIKIRPADDIYWSAVKRVYYQLSGIIAGYDKKDFTPNLYWGYHPILLINLGGDLYDLERKFNKTKEVVDKRLPDSGRCSGFVKLAPNNADLFISQVTMSGYQMMTRILKLYKFAYYKHEYPGHTTTFASYPGMLYSSDDFALMSSGLAVIETTINVFNNTLYNRTIPKEQIHCWVRAIVSNQLARNGREWCEIFSRYNSGTYNNQWVVLDYNKFKPHQPLPKYGVLYVLEQLPGMSYYKDVTWYLMKYSYFASYNIPFYRPITKFSGFLNKSEHDGPWFSWKNAPRAKIFARDHHKVTNLDSLRTLMRYNDYTHEEFSKCNCTPPYSAEAAISARGDLNPKAGKYEFPGQGHNNHGALDYKGTNYELFQNLTFRAISSPAYDQVPAFKWSTFDMRDTIKHIGLPDEWKFPEIEIHWETSIDD